MADSSLIHGSDPNLKSRMGIWERVMEMNELDWFFICLVVGFGMLMVLGLVDYMYHGKG